MQELLRQIHTHTHTHPTRVALIEWAAHVGVAGGCGREAWLSGRAKVAAFCFQRRHQVAKAAEVCNNFQQPRKAESEFNPAFPPA